MQPGSLLLPWVIFPKGQEMSPPVNMDKLREWMETKGLLGKTPGGINDVENQQRQRLQQALQFIQQSILGLNQPRSADTTQPNWGAIYGYLATLFSVEPDERVKEALSELDFFIIRVLVENVLENLTGASADSHKDTLRNFQAQAYQAQRQSSTITNPNMNGIATTVNTTTNTNPNKNPCATSTNTSERPQTTVTNTIQTHSPIRLVRPSEPLALPNLRQGQLTQTNYSDGVIMGTLTNPEGPR